MSKPLPQPHHVADRLHQSYQREFGGKKEGRFIITRKKLLMLADRQRLATAFFEDVRDQLADLHDLIIMDVGEDRYLVEDSVSLGEVRGIPDVHLLQSGYFFPPADLMKKVVKVDP